MKMQVESNVDMDVYFDIERVYFEQEANILISESNFSNKNLLDVMRKKYVDYTIEQLNHNPLKDDELTNMLDKLQKSGRFLESSTIKKYYTRNGKYLISNDYRIEIIESLEDAIQIFNNHYLTDLEKKDNRKYFYRGQENVYYKLIPSIMRNENYLKKEDQLYAELQTVSPTNFTHSKKHLEILTEMQHFSLPTRLLDISSNPLSALFFATNTNDSKNFSIDGEIIVFSVDSDKVKTFSSDLVEIQSSLAFLPYDIKNKIFKHAKKILSRKNTKQERIEQFNEDSEVKKLIHEARKSGVFFSEVLDPEDLFSFEICLPLKKNDRIMNQSGAFINYGFTSKKAFQSEIQNEQMLYENRINRKFRLKEKNNIIRFIVPSYAKTKIREQLEELGINKGNIYPDIERRASYIKDKFWK